MEELFKDRSLKSIALELFCFRLPGRLEFAKMNSSNTHILEYADALDNFEFHLRYYMYSTHIPLDVILDDTRNAMTQTLYIPNVLNDILKQIRTDIIDNELYELMIKYEFVEKNILIEINNHG